MFLGYVTGDGCSGITYKLGLLEAAKKTHPALLMYENVVGVAERATAEDGSKLPPLTEASSHSGWWVLRNHWIRSDPDIFLDRWFMYSLDTLVPRGLGIVDCRPSL